MIRRLSRVADSSQYDVLRRRQRRWLPGKGRQRGEPTAAVAQGHVPVYVGEEMERFEIPTELLNRPAFIELLHRSAEEFGYEQSGVLRIPCPAPLFRRLIRAAGTTEKGEEEAEELLRSFDEWVLSTSDQS